MDTTRPSLLLRIRDLKDRAAWQTFDQIYRPLLVRYAQGCGLEVGEAEDVAQDCLNTVSQRIDSFDYDPARGRFKAWLGTIARNRARNALRARRGAAGGDALLDAAGDDAPRPDEAFERMWLEQHLWHCLDELRGSVDAKTYQAFVAHVIEERPIEVVCDELELTPNNVYTIKWRLTQRIATRMRELTHDDEA